MTDYQKNRLEVYSRRLEEIKKNNGFFKKNLVKVIIFGIIFSLIAPSYNGDSTSKIRLAESESILDKMGGNYLSSVLLTLAIYTLFCIIGHIGFGIQDKMRIKKFRKLIKNIEDEIQKDA